MRTLLLTAAAAAALVAASPALQAQDAQSQSGTVEPRSVKTETIRRTDQPGQAATDSRGTETTAADTQKVQRPSASHRIARVHRQHVATRHRARPVPTRTRGAVTTGQATGRVSSGERPARAGTRYARAAYVAPAVVPADRIALTEPQVAQLNAAFADYIVRMNVWSRPVWDFPATVGGPVPGWVQVYGVPAEIVAIDPAFSGDQFLVVGDDIVVLDPGTRRIVAMISRVNGTAVAALPPATTAVAPPPDERVRLTRTQIATIRTVLREAPCRYDRPAGFLIGSAMPAAARVCAFPERVVAVVPDVAGYRYITRRNAVVVVDPATDRVVTVLR